MLRTHEVLTYPVQEAVSKLISTSIIPEFSLQVGELSFMPRKSVIYKGKVEEFSKNCQSNMILKLKELDAEKLAKPRVF